jgi:hypothetical protein
LKNGITPIGSAKRMPDGAARLIIEQMAALENRINAQQPVAGEDSALRRLFRELAQGKPEYDRMTPKLASEVKSVVALDQQLFSALGPLVSISFEQVTASGIDKYRVMFQNGEGDMEVSLDDDGKIQHALYSQE